ncbi:MAG: acylphosphatase [Candidatus Methanoperedenaceae archaeon]|nr:acylphosphatase [Candidatus Methanoperedenaceae archaeon]
MKLKFIIQGENVQEVGYRVFLFNNAFNYGISKFNAFNVNKNQVFAFVEGDEETLNNYVGFCKENKPEGAIVENILTEAYNGEIGDTQTFATILTLEQLNKGVPAILEIKGDIKEIKGDIKEMKGDVKQVLVKQGETIHEIRNLRSDMKLYLDTKFEEVFFEIGRIKEKIGLS